MCKIINYLSLRKSAIRSFFLSHLCDGTGGLNKVCLHFYLLQPSLDKLEKTVEELKRKQQLEKSKAKGIVSDIDTPNSSSRHSESLHFICLFVSVVFSPCQVQFMGKHVARLNHSFCMQSAMKNKLLFKLNCNNNVSAFSGFFLGQVFACCTVLPIIRIFAEIRNFRFLEISTHGFSTL